MMKLTPLKLILSALAGVTLTAAVGCAASAPDELEDDGVTASEQDLSSRAAKFVGSYSYRAADSGDFLDFEKLTLGADGKYDAKVDSTLVDRRVACIRFPCTLPESGRWSVSRIRGALRLRVDPAGPRRARLYFVSIDDLTQTLSLTRRGETTRLFSDGLTCANVRCAAGTHCELEGAPGSKRPVCRPDLTCASVLCAPGTTCEDTPTGPLCQPIKPPGCAVVLCAPGTVCEETPKGPKCVPQPPVSCAAVTCLVGHVCVEKPTGAECVPAPAPCVKTGCSSHVCADEPVITTCEFRPEYACYQQAQCERQADGACGFTQTPSLKACLANPPQ